MLTHQDYVSNFNTLLVTANEKLIHQKHLELLMTEVYNGLSPKIMNDISSLEKISEIFIYLKAKILDKNDTV